MFTIVRQQEFPFIDEPFFFQLRNRPNSVASNKKILPNMDFNFSLGQLVGNQEIFVIDKLMRPYQTADRLSSSQSNLAEVIDKLGAASAKAQGLPSVITTSRKLAYTDQRVYLYIDIQANSAVGFIKVGVKKLFLYDHHGNQRETDPLCILDFYVHESKQRKGYGRRLYEFMLKNEDVLPAHLAIDKPSDKFLGFLSKHYKLRAAIPQVNNYAIFEGFFTNRKEKAGRRAPRTSHQELAGNPMGAVQNGSSNLESRSMDDIATRQYLATSNSSTSLSSAEELSALADIPIARPSSREKLANCRNSPLTQTADYGHKAIDNLAEDVTQLAVTNGGRSQSAQNSAYSRHTTLTSAPLPYQYSTSNKNDYQEPLRTRYGQPGITNSLNTHQHVQNKQGHLRVTQSKPNQNNNVVNHKPQQDAGDWSRNFHSSDSKASKPNSSWNVFGVPPGYSHIANRKAS